MNSDLQQEAWVIVRDKEDHLAYYGWIHTYSTGQERNELFLVDVTIYDNTNRYGIDDITGYLSLKAKRQIHHRISICKGYNKNR